MALWQSSFFQMGTRTSIKEALDAPIKSSVPHPEKRVKESLAMTSYTWKHSKILWNLRESRIYFRPANIFFIELYKNVTCYEGILSIQRMERRRWEANTLDGRCKADDTIQPQDGDIMQMRWWIVFAVKDRLSHTIEILIRIGIETARCHIRTVQCGGVRLGSSGNIQLTEPH